MIYSGGMEKKGRKKRIRERSVKTECDGGEGIKEVTKIQKGEIGKALKGRNLMWKTGDLHIAEMVKRMQVRTIGVAGMDGRIDRVENNTWERTERIVHARRMIY